MTTTSTRHASAGALIAVLLAVPLALAPSHAADAAVAATWSPVVDLSEPGGRTFAPQIMGASDGSLTAIWVRRDGANNTLAQVSRSTDGGSTWTTPHTLSAAGQNAVSAQLAAGSDNTIMATWVRNDGSHNIIQASHFDGTSWGPPQDLSAPGNSANSVEVTAGPDGSFAAIWDRQDGVGFIIQVAHFDGASWAPPLDLSSSALSALPDIAASGSEMVAVWQRNEGGSLNYIQGSHFDGTVWGAPEYLTGASPVNTSPRVSAAPDGTFAAAWAANGPVGGVTFARVRIFDQGVWGAVSDLSDGLSGALWTQIAPVGGGFAAVWQDSAPPIRAVASHYDGTSWSAPVVFSDPARPSRQPKIIGGANGTAAALWLHNNGTHSIIAASNFDGIDWSAPVALSAAGQDADRATLAALPDGTFAALWYRSNGSHQIAQSAFTMSAPIITSPAPPAPTLGSAYSFEVTASGNPRPTFAVTGGALPAGLAMSSAGLISGTPTAAGSATFTVTASNGVAPDDSETYTLAISAAAAPAAGPGQPQLAASGADPLPLTVAGLAALAVGAALLVRSKKRPQRG